MDKEAVTAEYLEYARRLRPYVRDTGVLVYEAVKSGKKCYLRELRGDARYRFGHLSVRNQLPSGFGGFTTGAGVGPNSIEEVIGIVKALHHESRRGSVCYRGRQ